MRDAQAATSLTRQSQKKALVALFVGAVCISLSPIFVRLSDLGPSASAFYRTGLAVPILLIWGFFLRAGHRQPKLAPRNGREAWLLILAGAFFAGDLAFWHRSIELTSVANATLFPSLSPVLVTIAAYYLFGERITRGFLLGLFIAVVGAMIIVSDSFEQDGDHVTGDMLGLVTAFFYAGYLLVVAKLRQTTGVLIIMIWSSAISGLLLLLLCVVQGVDLTPASFSGWAVLIGLAGISQAGGQGLIAYALAHLPVSFSSVGLLLQPALAALLAYVILFEAIGFWQGIGVVVILTGIYLARRGRVRDEPGYGI